jgi:glycosyltransferase involved in cell wall biosynthesis
LSRALARQNVKVSIVGIRVSGRYPARACIDGVHMTFLNVWHSVFERRGFRRLGQYAFLLCALGFLARHRDEYDVIHAHSPKMPGFASVLAARRLGKKSVVKLMNSGPRNDFKRWRGEKTIWGSRAMADYLLNCDRIIALNDLAYRELTAFGFRTDQIALIPNGVEVDRFTAKTSYDIADATRVVFVGRLAQAKGLDVLLEALGRLNTQTPGKYQLTIVGKGSLREPLEATAETLGIAESVHFAGQVEDVSPFLSHSDVFVLPSRAEGISNALLEAMATGLPCIASDIPGNHALIQNGENGLLVESDNPQALAEAIHEMSIEPEQRIRLGQAARKTVESRSDIAVTAKQYIELYRKVLQT